MLLRRFAFADAEIKAGNYAKFRARMVADNLAGIEGLLVGLIGFGTIGRAVAQAFVRAGAKICFFDPAPGDAALAATLGARSVTFDELLATSDVVSVHVPLLPATQNLIGDRELSRMKPGAVLIQASRGGIVDEAALAAHLTFRSSRRRGGRCLLDRAAGRRQSAAQAFRRGGAPADPHAAHRRRHAPSLDVPVPLGLAKRRAGADPKSAAAQSRVLEREITSEQPITNGCVHDKDVCDWGRVENAC